MSSLLPKNVNIINIPEICVPESRTYYNRQNAISNIDVVLNYKRLQNLGEKGLVFFCREIGHTVVVEDADLELQKLKQLFFIEKRLPKNNAETPADVLLATQYSMQELGIYLDKEIQAWDYGKSYKDLFGINDEIYESLKDKSIRAYVYNWTLRTRKELEMYVSKLGSLDDLKDQIKGKIKIYDINTKSYIKKSFKKTITNLNSFKEEESKRLNDIASGETF